jgi:PadR family transcriptional regulator, regulatory protein PadR
MATGPRLTPQTIAVLRVLLAEPGVPHYGLEIARETGLKTGTLHPILGRLQQAGWVESFWEEPTEHENQGRPRRRYYSLYANGTETIRQAVEEATQDNELGATHLRPQPGY